MHLAHTESERALRTELRSYFARIMTPQRLAETRGNEGGDAYQEVIRQLGRDGWLALGWPEEYGGQGRGAREQLIFFEEAQLARCPIPFVTINTVAPALMAHGSDEHKQHFLPRIAAGELHFCIGYSEPGAGTDLAALSTTAVREGDEFVINGTKVFTSSAEAADYVWLAARTTPDTPRPHEGISILMVPTDQPGFSYSPIYTVGDVRTNVSYYTDVRTPVSMVAGELDQGWRLITSQLNHERVGLAAIGVTGLGLYQQVLDWARTEADGRRPIDDPRRQLQLAEAHNRLEAMRLLNWRMAWMLDHSEPTPAFASALKIYSTECLIEIYRLLMDVIGEAALLRHDSVGAVLGGELETEYRKCQINTFGGGVAEVMRDLVASFGLNMRAYRR